MGDVRKYKARRDRTRLVAMLICLLLLRFGLYTGFHVFTRGFSVDIASR
jgi:hypothetical protein